MYVHHGFGGGVNGAGTWHAPPGSGVGYVRRPHTETLRVRAAYAPSNGKRHGVVGVRWGGAGPPVVPTAAPPTRVGYASVGASATGADASSFAASTGATFAASRAAALAAAASAFAAALAASASILTRRMNATTIAAR
jgi:hypothetical protein